GAGLGLGAARGVAAAAHVAFRQLRALDGTVFLVGQVPRLLVARGSGVLLGIGHERSPFAQPTALPLDRSGLSGDPPSETGIVSGRRRRGYDQPSAVLVRSFGLYSSAPPS